MSDSSHFRNVSVESTGTRTSQKPLLLLDIDGALSPMIEPGEEGAEDLLWVTAVEGVAPQLPVWLARLSSVFELVWATSWEAEANDVFGPALGLSELPFVAFDKIGDDWTWKLPCVMEYVGARAFAWVDDVLGPDARTAAKSHAAPSLLISTQPTIGLIEEHYRLLMEFAESLA